MVQTPRRINLRHVHNIRDSEIRFAERFANTVQKLRRIDVKIKTANEMQDTEANDPVTKINFADNAKIAKILSEYCS